MRTYLAIAIVLIAITSASAQSFTAESLLSGSDPQAFESRIALLAMKRAEAEQQLARQNDLLQQLQAYMVSQGLQNLQAKKKGASAKKPSDKAVSDTLKGLTTAIKFWGSFVGNNAFDSSMIEKKIAELKSKGKDISEYAGDTGSKALIKMNQSIWGISTSIQAIKAMATLLKKGATNVMMISSIARKDKVETLSEKNQKIYEAALKVLVNTLKSSDKAAGEIKDKLDYYSKTLIQVQFELSAIAKKMRDTAAGKGKAFNDWKSKMRAIVYGSCGASAICPPCAAACFAAAVPILEGKIKDQQKKIDAYVKDWQGWAKAFDGLSTMAKDAAAVSKSWYTKVVEFQTVIQTQLDLFDGGVTPVLYLSSALRDNADNNLKELIAASDKVLQDSTGVLKKMDASDKKKKMAMVMEEVMELRAARKYAKQYFKRSPRRQGLASTGIEYLLKN